MDFTGKANSERIQLQNRKTKEPSKEETDENKKQTVGVRERERE